MRRILLFAGYFATASAAVRLTDIYGGELHMRHFQSRMVKDARETGVGQAGATYQPREGARLLVRGGAAAGRVR